MSRRRAYGGLFVVRGIAGMAFALSGWPPLLIAAALTGTLPTDANESGPITSLEQAMLGGADARMRPRVFGRYNAVAYLCGSVGALAAGGPTALRHFVPMLTSSAATDDRLTNQCDRRCKAWPRLPRPLASLSM